MRASLTRHPTRWILLAVALVAVALTAPDRKSIWQTALPLVIGFSATLAFAPSVAERWARRGLLLAADATLVGLALAVVGADTRTLVGLALAVVFSVALGDGRRAGLASAASIAALWSIGSRIGLPPPGVAEIAGLAVIAAALADFGRLGVAVLNSSLADGTRDVAAIRPAESELWALLDITDSVTGSLNLSDVMHLVVDRVGDFSGTPSCSILLVDRDSPSGFVVASKGHREAEMMPVDLEKYPEVRRAIRSRDAVVVHDVAADPLVAEAREVLLARGYRSLAVLPLLHADSVIGALFLKSRQQNAFNPAILRFCRVAAGISANALKNAMLYRDVAREAASHRETGEKLRRVLDGTPDMIVATDVDGRITEFNRGAEKCCGLTTQAAFGCRLSELVDPATLERATSDASAHDVVVTAPDGRQVEVSLVGAPLTDGEATVVGQVWIGRDVTQLRRAERSLAQAERLSSLGEIVAGVAHELNNPLSGVVGYAELLRTHAQDPEQIRDLDRIVESALRCQKIVMKLLSFARKQAPEKHYADLNESIRKVLDLKSYQLCSSKIEVDLALAEGLPRTCFDPFQIEQVLLNLVNNAEQAISAVKRSGMISIRTAVDGAAIVVEIEDDGAGVRASVRDRIFDPFFTTKELGQGTGLGLSVSYGIVEEHGGRLELRPSAPASEGGACFRISLPIVVGQARTTTEDPAGQPVGERSFAGRRVLVAEDDAMVLELIARVLTDLGAEVTQATDGLEAWERMGHHEWDLVVTDLRMPHLGGQELYERTAEERPELMRRFVFATGDLVREETLAFLRGLPNRILTKPLEIQTVRRVLSQALALTG